MELRFAALFGRADGDLENAAVFARSAQRFAFGGKRFDEDAAPAVFFEQPRLAEFHGRVGANFDEKAISLFVEKFPDQYVFPEL